VQWPDQPLRRAAPTGGWNLRVGEEERQGASREAHGGKSIRRARRHEGGTWDAASGRRQTLDRELGAGAADEGSVLLGRQHQVLGQQCRDLARGAAGVALDPDDQVLRAADQCRERLLGQVERFAAALDPLSERL
jgi:hypothetical protein